MFSGTLLDIDQCHITNMNPAVSELFVWKDLLLCGSHFILDFHLCLFKVTATSMIVYTSHAVSCSPAKGNIVPSLCFRKDLCSYKQDQQISSHKNGHTWKLFGDRETKETKTKNLASIH